MRPVDVLALKGNPFRVVQQSPLSQSVVMTLKSKEEIGKGELHNGDQILYFLDGEGEVTLGTKKFQMTKGMTITIPPGTQHQLYNTGKSDLFFLKIYTPPSE